ncbi:hypothetical protein BSPWISOXPB_4172, partial [uncultured Gammaproteobacteria bacterium]
TLIGGHPLTISLPHHRQSNTYTHKPPATNQKTATDKNKLTMPKRPNAIENLQFTVICLTIEPDTYRGLCPSLRMKTLRAIYTILAR